MVAEIKQTMTLKKYKKKILQEICDKVGIKLDPVMVNMMTNKQLQWKIKALRIKYQL